MVLIVLDSNGSGIKPRALQLAERFDTLNPAQARQDVAALQQSLLSLVARQNITRRGEQNATYLAGKIG